MRRTSSSRGDSDFSTELVRSFRLVEIAAWTGRPTDLASVENLKFKRPILPGQTLTLVLQSDAQHARFRFQMEDDAGVFSLGRIVLAADGEAP